MCFLEFTKKKKFNTSRKPFWRLPKCILKVVDESFLEITENIETIFEVLPKCILEVVDGSFSEFAEKTKTILEVVKAHFVGCRWRRIFRISKRRFSWTVEERIFRTIKKRILIHQKKKFGDRRYKKFLWLTLHNTVFTCDRTICCQKRIKMDQVYFMCRGLEETLDI